MRTAIDTNTIGQEKFRHTTTINLPTLGYIDTDGIRSAALYGNTTSEAVRAAGQRGVDSWLNIIG